MASSTDVSKKALEDIKALLDVLNDDDAWDLVNTIRDTCNVVIPVWFTPDLVKEITDERLGVQLNDEEAIDIAGKVNNNDMAYFCGRDLVVNLIESSLPEEDSESEDDSETGADE